MDGLFHGVDGFFGARSTSGSHRLMRGFEDGLGTDPLLYDDPSCCADFGTGLSFCSKG